MELYENDILKYINIRKLKMYYLMNVIGLQLAFRVKLLIFTAGTFPGKRHRVNKRCRIQGTDMLSTLFSESVPSIHALRTFQRNP